MRRQEIQSRLITELKNIGIPTETGTTADIVIDQEYTEQNNNGSVHYQGKLLLDDLTHTIIFWEKPNGYSKVKSIGTDKKGHHKDIILDLNTIPVFIKSFAKSQHWSYKHVTDESKASYKEPHIPSPTPQNKGCFFQLFVFLIALLCTAVLFGVF